jgi:Glycosyltransferase 61
MVRLVARGARRRIVSNKVAFYAALFFSVYSQVQQSILLLRESSSSSRTLDTDGTFPPTKDSIRKNVAVTVSSLDRLLQLAAVNGTFSIPLQCPKNHTCDKDKESSHISPRQSTSHEVIYVNCAAVTSAPLSLLQCRDLLHRAGALDDANDVVTIVPRHDLFLASSAAATASTTTTVAALTLPFLAPLGTLHFHARKPPPPAVSNSSDSTQRGGRRTRHHNLAEVEWFIDRIHRHNQTRTFYYPLLARTLAHAYGCRRRRTKHHHGTGKNHGPLLYQCPLRSSSDDAAALTWIAPESVWDIVRPIMYQWPLPPPPRASAKPHRRPRRRRRRRRDPPRERHAQTVGAVDPVIPSVGIFRHAFCEMQNGRLLLHIPIRPEPCHHCRDRNETIVRAPTAPPPTKQHRQVLIQLNQCNLPTALASNAWNKTSYEPFRLRVVSPTTLAMDSRADLKLDAAIVISARWMGDFYHTAVEHLPRLLLMRDFILALPDQTIPIVVPRGFRKSYNLIQHYANIWGLGHRVVVVGAMDVVYAKTMYIPEPTPCLALQPILAQAQRHAIRSALQREPLPPSKSTENQSQFQPPLGVEAATAATDTLLVNSATATETSTFPESATDKHDDDLDIADWIVVIRRRKGRFLRNHDDMMAALTTALPHEKWYVFDEGNVDGKFPAPGIPQWQVFARAKLVVAPHGAGLANLLACPPNIDVVEMLGEGGDTSLCFLHLALALGLRYHPVHMIHPNRFGNYEADIEQVVHVVTSIVQSERTRTNRHSLTASTAYR